TCCTRRAPTCSAASAAWTRRQLRTGGHWISRRARRSGGSSCGGSLGRRGLEVRAEGICGWHLVLHLPDWAAEGWGACPAARRRRERRHDTRGWGHEERIDELGRRVLADAAGRVQLGGGARADPRAWSPPRRLGDLVRSRVTCGPRQRAAARVLARAPAPAPPS